MNTLPLDEIEKAHLVRSLQSDTCPSCGGMKTSGHSVCRRKCWPQLSRFEKAALYKRIGDGYEAAFNAAMNTLGCASIRLPIGGGK